MCRRGGRSSWSTSSTSNPQLCPSQPPKLALSVGRARRRPRRTPTTTTHVQGAICGVGFGIGDPSFHIWPICGLGDLLPKNPKRFFEAEMAQISGRNWAENKRWPLFGVVCLKGTTHSPMFEFPRRGWIPRDGKRGVPSPVLPPPPRVPPPFFPRGQLILGGEKIESACVQKLQKWEPQEVDRPRPEGGKHASKSATAHFL